MRRFGCISITLLLILFLALGCQDSNNTAPLSATDVVGTNSEVSISAAPPISATVTFGNPRGGTRQARHSLVPRTVVISAGPLANVTYQVNGFHQPTVFPAGTEPDDIIDINPNDGRVDDPNSIAQSLAPGTQFWTTPAGIFNAPGRYLVICNITGHFFNEDMYGWVIVK